VFSDSSIQTCHATQRHILAFEEDKDIFNAIIAPQMRKSVVTRAELTLTNPDSIEMEKDNVEPKRIVMTN